MDEGRASEHTQTHTNEVFSLQATPSQLRLGKTVSGRCSAFVIFVVFLVAPSGGATVHRK